MEGEEWEGREKNIRDETREKVTMEVTRDQENWEERENIRRKRWERIIVDMMRKEINIRKKMWKKVTMKIITDETEKNVREMRENNNGCDKREREMTKKKEKIIERD